MPGNSRRFWLSALTVTLVLACVAVPLFLLYPRRNACITKANFARLHEGMSRAEVERILGGPPGDYATVSYYPIATGLRFTGWEWWIGNEGTVAVYFDEESKVQEMVFWETAVIPESLWDRIRWQLRSLGW